MFILTLLLSLRDFLNNNNNNNINNNNNNNNNNSKNNNTIWKVQQSQSHQKHSYTGEAKKGMHQPVRAYTIFTYVLPTYTVAKHTSSI